MNIIIKKILIIPIMILSIGFANIAYSGETIVDKNQAERMHEWRQAGFGLFVHWGPYSELGGVWQGKTVEGYAEHIMRKLQIPLDAYKKEAVAKFNPTQFNAKQWVKTLKSAGMNYLVVTAKHHDGFAMWDSKVSDYDIIDATAFNRDPMRELRDACKEEGILFGFYYSHAQDWSHPYGQRNLADYPYQPVKQGWAKDKNWQDYIKKSAEYVNQKSIPQLKELINNYQPDIIWFDTPFWLSEQQNRKIVDTAKALDPTLIINSRGTGTKSLFDYMSTADKPVSFPVHDGYWEAIPTTNESYGYHSADLGYKSSEYFIKMLVNANARGGNLLLNVGPMGNGLITDVDQSILKGIGDWLKVNNKAIFGATATPLPTQAWGNTTVNNDNVYLHIFDWPENGRLILSGITSKIDKGYLLADNSKALLDVKRINNFDLEIILPKQSQRDPVTVIVLPIKEQLVTDDARRLTDKADQNELHVFESKLYGEKLSYGEGNKRWNHITGWSELDSYIEWSLRINDAQKFNVYANYSADEKSAGSRFSVNIAGQTLSALVQVAFPLEVKKHLLGQINLPKGQHQLTVTPQLIKGDELMKLTSVSLEVIKE